MYVMTHLEEQSKVALLNIKIKNNKILKKQTFSVYFAPFYVVQFKIEIVCRNLTSDLSPWLAMPCSVQIIVRL